MAVDVLLTTVRFIHILAGIAWVGGAAYMGLVVGRSLTPLPPQVKGPAMGAIGPAGYRFLTWAGVVTIVFGIANQVLLASRNAVPGAAWHQVIGGAFLVSLAMMGVAGAVIGPSLRKLTASPPPADAPQIQGRLMKASMVNLALGVLAVLLMVIATKMRVT